MEKSERKRMDKAKIIHHLLKTHALIMDGKALIPAILIAMTHALDAAVPPPVVREGSFEGQMSPRI